MKIKIFAFAIFALAILSVASADVIAQTEPEGTLILTSAVPADAAVSELLTEKLDAERIITDWGTFTDEILDTIEQINPETLIIVGGENAIPETAEIEIGKLEAEIKIERLAGEDRFETALLVAERGWETAEFVFIVDGNDRIAIEEIKIKARAEGAPILFTTPDGLPENVKIRIKTKLEVKRVQVKLSPDTDQEEIENDLNEADVEEVEIEEVGNAEERAREAIEDAEKEITDLEEELAEVEADANSVAAEVLHRNALRNLERARNAFEENKFGKAFGQAVSAEVVAENAERLLDDIEVDHLADDVEEIEGDIEEEGIEKVREELGLVEREIEIDIGEGQAKIDVEIDAEEIEFTLDTTDREEIVAEIVTRTDLTEEQVEELIPEFEVGEGAEANVKGKLKGGKIEKRVKIE